MKLALYKSGLISKVLRLVNKNFYEVIYFYLMRKPGNNVERLT